MTDLDAAFARLRDMPVDPRLAKVDAAVLDGLARAAAAPPFSATVFGTAALAALALALGFAGALVPGTPAGATPAPFGAPPALAPSSLLAGSE